MKKLKRKISRKKSKANKNFFSNLHPDQKLGLLIASIVFGFVLVFTVYQFVRDPENTFSDQINISISASNLPPTTNGHYALWGVTDDESRIFIDRFRYLENQLLDMALNPVFEVSVSPDYEFVSYELSTERNGDRDDIQSPCVLMSGVQDANSERIELTNTIFNQNTRENFDGSFMIATLTDKTENTNEQSGVWFINPGIEASSLYFPDLSNNNCWEYSIHVLYRDQYLKVGDLQDTSARDDFSEYSLPETSFRDYPGEDFLRNISEPLVEPLDLISNESELIISIRPREDVMNLFFEDRPFWEIFNYQIKQDDTFRTPIQIEEIDQPTFKLEF